MEIVSKPDLRSPRQAQAYVSKLRTILRYLGTCDGDMEKGNLRADVNVSVRRPGADLGTRCEIKNVNSIRFIGQAIEAEARRQIDILEDGGSIQQETRLFDPAKGVTRSMRSKEEAHDYRYFPDPDLLPLELTQAYVDGLKKDLPELPDAKKARFMRDFKLSAYDAGVLVAEKETADFFVWALVSASNMHITMSAHTADPMERREAAISPVELEPGRTARSSSQERSELGDQRAVRPSEQGRHGDRCQSRFRAKQLGAILKLIDE